MLSRTMWVMISVFVGLGAVLAMANTATAQTETPTPTSTPEPAVPQWVPALFDEGYECPDLDTASFDLTITNFLSGTTEIVFYGESAASVAFNTEYCNTASDLSEIAEPYRTFQNMFNWPTPGVYGFRFRVGEVIEPTAEGGNIHFPNANSATTSDVPGWETITGFEAYEDEILCFYYGGLAGDETIDVDGDCDHILRTSASPRGLDGDDLIWFTIGLWGQTLDHYPVSVTIENPEWIIVGEASDACNTQVEIEWNFESPPTTGEWAASGFSRSNEDSYTPSFSLKGDSAGTITTTLTYSEALDMVHAHQGGYTGPLLNPHVSAWVHPQFVGGSIALRIEFEDGSFAEVSQAGGGEEWTNITAHNAGVFHAFHIVTTGADNFLDDIELTVLLPCQELNCEIVEWTFDTDIDPEWQHVDYGWYTQGATAGGSMSHDVPGESENFLTLAELQTVLSTTEGIISDGMAVTATIKSTDSDNSTRIELRWTDGTITATDYWAGTFVWTTINLAPPSGLILDSVVLYSRGFGVLYDDIELQVCSYEPLPPDPPPPDPPPPIGDGGGGLCYACPAPAYDAAVGYWIAYLACVINNLFWCALRAWLSNIESATLGTTTAIRTLALWIPYNAQLAANHGKQMALWWLEVLQDLFAGISITVGGDTGLGALLDLLLALINGLFGLLSMLLSWLLAALGAMASAAGMGVQLILGYWDAFLNPVPYDLATLILGTSGPSEMTPEAFTAALQAPGGANDAKIILLIFWGAMTADYVAGQVYLNFAQFFLIGLLAFYFIPWYLERVKELLPT